MDWLDLLAVQGTRKNLLQHHSSKASILPLSAFFTVLTLTSIYDHWTNLVNFPQKALKNGPGKDMKGNSVLLN